MGGISCNRETTSLQVSSSHRKGCWRRAGAPGRAEVSRGPLEGTVHPGRDRWRESGQMDSREQPAEATSHPGQGVAEMGSVSDMPQSVHGTLGLLWRGLQGRREMGRGAEKCGCKRGGLTAPLEEPRSQAGPCPWLGSGPRLRWARRPLQGSPESPAGGGGTASHLLTSWPVGSPLHPASSSLPLQREAPRFLRSLGTTECGPSNTGEAKPKCQSLQWHAVWAVILLSVGTRTAIKPASQSGCKDSQRGPGCRRNCHF